MTNNTKIVTTFILLVLLSLGCYNKRVTIKKSNNTSFFVLQLENAELYFGKEIVLNASIQKIEVEKIEDRKQQMMKVYERLKKESFDKLYVNENLDSLSTVVEVENFLILDLVKDDLLRQGNAKVFNRLTEKFENKIVYNIQKNKLGEKGEVFKFLDGTKFYYNKISIGE